VRNERVTPHAHFQDARLVRLNLALPLDATTSISPGDCVTIFPSNPPATVSRVLELQPHWPADAPVVLPARLPAGLYQPASADEPSTTTTTTTIATTTFRALLTNHLDPSAVPRRSFLAALAPFAADPYQRERLREFADPRYADELHDYTTRPRRTILEVLEEFDSVRVPVERVLDVLPVLRGRDFSVANYVGKGGGPADDGSGGDESDGGGGGASKNTLQIEILVALVQYRTILRVPRVGLCSAYLGPLTPPHALTLALKPSPSPLAFAPSRPVIAIATGTGIAPMRAFIQSRHGTPDGPSRTVLFFGCRSRGVDDYFAAEWARTPGLELHVAYSRDQAHKVYVQDAIRAQAPAVAALVCAGAAVALCGGSARMAEACRHALRDALVEVEGIDKDEAQAAVARLDWWQEIWA
jgi:sulfite reductase alpha subunit-like flavoprotein